jgi:hypothetical protein
VVDLRIINPWGRAACRLNSIGSYLAPAVSAALCQGIFQTKLSCSNSIVAIVPPACVGVSLSKWNDRLFLNFIGPPLVA